MSSTHVSTSTQLVSDPDGARVEPASGPDPVVSADYARVVHTVWRRVGWAAALEYVVGSPSLLLLPAGSTLRGLVLASLPLAAAVIAFRGFRGPVWRGGREVLVPFMFVLVVVWQCIATAANLGVGYLTHIVPAICLLLLALRARASQYWLTLGDYRRCLAALVPPFVAVQVLGLIVQLIRPPAVSDPSSLPIGVHGSRLMGLAVHPVAYGLFTGMILLVALVARGNRRSMIFYQVVLVVLLVLSNARTAYLGTLAALIVLWLLEPARSLGRRLIPLVITVLVLPILLQFLLVARARTAGGILTGRDLIWRNTLNLLQDVGTFGYGPNAIGRLFPTVGGPGSQISTAQNQWLNDAISFGWTSSILLLIFVVVIAMAGPLSHRRLLLWPLLAYVLFVTFSEQPLDLWNSTVQAYPLFLCLIVTSRGRRPLLQRSRAEALEEPVGVKGEFL